MNRTEVSTDAFRRPTAGGGPRPTIGGAPRQAVPKRAKKTRTKTSIVVHHAGSGPGAMSADFDKIKDWHTRPKAEGGNRGWRKIGYHWVINKDGTGHRGRQDHERGAHSIPGNARGLGVNVCGNFNAQTPTPEQIKELVRICTQWCLKHDITPGRKTIVGHKDLQPRKKKTDNKPERPNTCPGDNLYKKLPELRSAVAAKVAAHNAHSEAAAQQIGLYEA